MVGLELTVFFKSLIFPFYLVLILILGGCSSVGVEAYQDNSPKLVLEEYFDGSLTAHGVVKDWSGKVIRHFKAEIKSYWRDGVGVLEEDFVFADGEKQRRVWTLTPNGEGSYIAQANDVIGTAQAQVKGNALFMQYVLRAAYKQSTIDLTIDDRMYLVSPRVIVNESKMSKFGLPVGEVLLTIVKQ